MKRGRGFRPLPAQRLIYREMWREGQRGRRRSFHVGLNTAADEFPCAYSATVRSYVESHIFDDNRC